MLPLLIQLLITVIILDVVSVTSQMCYSDSSSCSNGVSVDYPFWMKDWYTVDSKYFCGYSGLSISCGEEHGGRPVINISNHLYYVQSINYRMQRLRILDVDIDGSECPQPRHNFSTKSAPVEIYSGGSMIFYYNCTNYPKDTKQHLPCLDHVSGSVTHRSFLFKADDNILKGVFKWYENCEAAVVTPYNYLHSSSNYTQILKVGFDLDWGRFRDSKQCEDSGGKSLYNQTAKAYHCLCYEGTLMQHVYASVCPPTTKGATPPRTPPSTPPSKMVGSQSYRANTTTGVSIEVKVIIGVCAGVGASLIILFLSYRGIFSITCCLFFPHWRGKVRNPSNVEIFLENCESLATQRYKYSDIKTMTDSFKEILGQGGFGSVFKGKLRDGKLVAVKVLNDSKSNGDDFINEVATISRTNHVNVVNLLGFCSDGAKRALVYEFMANGSLEKFIYNAKSSSNPCLPLGWEKLYQIALGIAKGLEYLHRGCNTRILHFDIKPHNILLDEDFCPKISDFGLAKLCPAKESTVSMLDHRGTKGYAAPEISCRILGGISHKADIYSYGMMVLEMIGGRKNLEVSVENSSQIYYPGWVYKHITPEVEVCGTEEVFEYNTVRKMTRLALWCIQTQPALRPSITKVVEMLEGDADELPMPPNPFQDPHTNSSP